MATAGSGWTTRRELQLSRIGRRPFMETILLVDDEAEVLATAREMLQAQGYGILDALNAEEAVRVAAAHHGPIDLLVTAVVMPGASGQDLALLLGLRHHQGPAPVLGSRQWPGARRADHPQAVRTRAPRGEGARGPRGKAPVALRPVARPLAQRLAA